MDNTPCPNCQKLQQRIAELEARTEQFNGGGKRRWMIAGALPFLVIAVLCGAAMVWTLRGERQARTAEQNAIKERDEARRAEAESKQQLDLAQSMRQGTAGQLQEMERLEQEEKRSAADTKAVLTFLQNNLFSSSGHPKSWAREGLGEKVTLRQAVDSAESKVSEAYPDRPLVRASIRETLGATYLELGEAAKAVQQYERALALRQEFQGYDNSSTVDCRNELAMAYRDAGRHDKASALFEQASESPVHAAAQLAEAKKLLSQKKPVEAERTLRSCLSTYQQIQPDGWAVFEAQSLLGAALLEQKRYKEAESLLLSGYKGLKERASGDKSRHAAGLEYLVRLYTDWGKPDKAKHWQEELQKTKATKKD
jgi:tetratricopeptide (TPR) repeat protein